MANILKNKNLKKILIWSLTGLVGITLLSIFAVYSQSSIVCSKINIEFYNAEKDRFIDSTDVNNLLNSVQGKLIGTKAKEINVNKLETAVNAHPMVKTAEVSKDIDGSINVKLKLRIPVVRVINTYNEACYIDIDGFMMPIGTKNIARVLIANGDIKDRFNYSSIKQMKDSIGNSRTVELFNLAKEINEDLFLNAQIEQIFIKKDSEVMLSPRVGRHSIEFGRIDNINEKLTKLKYFYTNKIGEHGWKTYKQISLKYKDQVVCQKYN